jgi:methyltransferase (TIGR00027 family)
MRPDRPSFTAAWVAAMRGLGAFLPERLRLIDDPFGLRFAGRLRLLRETPRVERGVRATARFWMRGYVRRFTIYMQLRTRVIDDDVAAFVAAGGRQLVLLGAGFDTRAWRLAALAGCSVFEVDHPATQAKKRALMGGETAPSRVVYVPWDFEREPLAELPARLAREGHDAGAPTMTILEGVLMYLTPEATDATFASVRAYSAPGSPMAITYMDGSITTEQSRAAASRRMAVRFVGEPFRSGLDAAALPDWLAARGFVLDRDESLKQLGGRLLGRVIGRRLSSARSLRSHAALVRRAPTTAGTTRRENGA